MQGAALVRRLKEKGRRLGLDAVGVALAAPSDHGAFLERWLAEGYAGAMGWMHRTAEVRADLRRRFPWVRTALVASVSYLTYRGSRHGQPGLVPHVSRYALGRDYHQVLGERLEELAALVVAEAPGARVRAYVDTGPVLERELAARAGLGWFGKHTNLIAPGGDSWILLGVVLTDLDLPCDEPVPDRCGTCVDCIEACPTGAILEPYLLDSTRCISYLTIELREPVPRSLRSGVGDWLFGCDICQEVCPWNRPVEPRPAPAFAAGPHLSAADLAGLIRLEDEEHGRRFGETPLARPRRPGLVRNALLVAANAGDERALEAAGDRLGDGNPMVRSTAAWALGRAGGGSRRRRIRAALESERDPEVRAEMAAALEESR